MRTETILATQDPEALRQIALQLHAQLAQQTRLRQQFEEALNNARRWRFGRKAEAFHAEQRSLFEEDLESDGESLELELAKIRPAAEAEKKRSGRKPLPAEIPREEQVLQPESDCCPDCGHGLRFLRDEVSERLEYVPASFIVHRHVRPQYSCDICQTVHAVALPAQIIEKGQPGPGLLAQVVISKCRDHLPLYRQQVIYRRQGVDIPRSTLSGWMGAVGVALSPLVAALHQRLLTHPVLHADETPLSILDPGKGKTARGYLWTYVSGAESGDGVVLFDCRPGRSGRYAATILQGWQGTLVTDDYAGYKALFSTGAIREAGCWAHVRRKFFEQYRANKGAVAQQALQRIRELYKLERLIKSRPPAKKRQWRRRYATPWLETFHDELLRQQQQTPVGSGIRNAIDYALKRWSSLLVYLEDGYVPIDNNRAENAIRPVAVGRKNWLFAGSLLAGQRMAGIMSLL